MSNLYRTAELLSASNIVFGTSGARGLVADFSPAVCAAFTAAFIASMRSVYSFKRIAIGTDLRPSSSKMASACISTARSCGLSVDFCGEIPTPGLAYYAGLNAIPAIMITGSHIPFDRNGIKFYRPDGEISKLDEQNILAVNAEFTEPENNDLPAASDEAIKCYMRRYTSYFPASMLTGWRVGVYQHSGVARDILVKLLTEFGADVVALGRTDDFVPIDTEAVSEKDHAMASAWAAAHNLDAIVSTDGDADRPMIADESGRWIRGDIVGLLTAKSLKISALAVPVSCNSAIERSGYFDMVRRTRIGSPYVIAAMNGLLQEHHVVAGFEANGGFMLGSELRQGNAHLSALPTRDALLPILSVLKAASDAGKSISALLGCLPSRFTMSDRLQTFPTDASQALIERFAHDPSLLLNALGHTMHTVVDVDMTDGLRVTVDNGDVIHLRPSGNAPELRCYVESESQSASEDLLRCAMGALCELREEFTGKTG